MNVYKRISKEEFENRDIKQLSTKDKDSIKTIVNNFRNYFVNKHT